MIFPRSLNPLVLEKHDVISELSKCCSEVWVIFLKVIFKLSAEKCLWSSLNIIFSKTGLFS